MPITTLSGDIKSFMAAPSFRNSGLDASSKGMSVRPRRSSSALTVCLTLADVPTGTVDFVTSSVFRSMAAPNSRATDSTWLRSAEPSSSEGVPTAQNTISTCPRTSVSEVAKCRRPAALLRPTRSDSPGSYIGISPALSRAIFSVSMSTQVTLTPISAKHAPETSPTYPVPTIAMFIWLQRVV